jgi:hypothetical protein
MLAYIRIGPSVESTFLDSDQIIGWQQITEAISFLDQGVEITSLWMECESRRVTRAGGKRRLIRAIRVEPLDGRFRLGFDSQIAG